MTCRIIVNGSAGRMGKMVLNKALESEDFQVVSAFEAPQHPDMGKDIGTITGSGQTGVKIGKIEGGGADALVDFSLPEAVDEIMDFCENTKTALVECTTGLSEKQVSNLEKLSNTVPVVRASNMSVGMNVLFSIVGKVAEALGSDYDIEIVEAHHRFKKDSPSGSALTLAEVIANSAKMDYPGCLTHGRFGKDCTRQDNTIGMHAVRAGGITGSHSVIYSALGETVTISHNAHSRETFAAGALRAAKWLKGKTPGLYSMIDVLNLK